MHRLSRLGWLVVLVVLLAGPRAFGYVDLAPTLGKVVSEAQVVAVVEVEKFSPTKNAVILKKVSELKGKLDDQSIRHQIAAEGAALPRVIREWAEPGARGVLFVSSNNALVCVGRGWYPVASSSDGWWKPVAERPDLPLAYCGTVSRLIEVLPVMLAGKSAIITAVPHGDNMEAASFDLALNRPAVLGVTRLVRVRASLQMPGSVMAVSSNRAYIVGNGPAGVEDLPRLTEALSAADTTTRAESAFDLGAMGAKAAPATGALAKLLDDAAPSARMAAAAALLRIDASATRALNVIEPGLGAADAITRRHAARAAGVAGKPAARFTPKLAALLGDEDELVRRAALGAIAALGPDAIGALDALLQRLEDPGTVDDVADALGRLGPAARAAQKPLAKLLASPHAATRWAAVRAMSQIGGPEAAPAVQFMIGVMKNNTEVEGYNMSIYLGLIGPDAKEALPALQRAYVKQPVLKSAVYWAIEPEKSFPWLNGGGRFGPPGGGDGMDVMRMIYEAYVNELGARMKPAGVVLAKKIVDGTAGEVPAWGYRVLAQAPEEAVATLAPALENADLIKRENATVALGFMGRSAAAAKPALEAALGKTPNEKEKRLIQWCLREIAK